MYIHTNYSFVLVWDVCTKAAQAIAPGALAMVACICFGNARACLGATRAQPLKPATGTGKLVSKEFRIFERHKTAKRHPECDQRTLQGMHRAPTST